MIDRPNAVRALLLLCGLALMSGCSDVAVEEAKPYVTDQKEKIREQSGTIHGNQKGIVLYSDRGDGALDDQGSSQGAAAEQASVAVAGRVNPFLWRASLESLDFMPLAQADSRGGVIISDWYAPPETPDERFKVTVYILDGALRADAVKVKVFRQVSGDGGWTDAAVDQATASGLEDNILKRARELRLASGSQG